VSRGSAMCVEVCVKGECSVCRGGVQCVWRCVLRGSAVCVETEFSVC